MSRCFDVGVVVPLYNKEETVVRAITALLEQTVRPARIIVIDDGSTDASVDRLRPFAHDITLIRQSNAGPGAARNAGIAQLDTTWVALADADNRWDPRRVERLQDFLADRHDIDWIAGQYHAQLPDGRCEVRPVWSEGDAVFSYFEEVERFFGFHCSETLVTRRELLQEIGGFSQRIRCYEITLLYLNLALRRPHVGFLGTPSAEIFIDTPSSLFQTRSRQLDGLLHYVDELRSLRHYFAPVPPFVDRLIVEAIEECLHFAQQQRNFTIMRRILKEYSDWLSTPLRWKTRVRCGLSRLRPTAA